ncbi:MAG TPA: hypothetical protein VGQ09_05165 [Chitinophagaceae bacterium]|jgi:hypothetical protein|nr:hypothetical protein [Chitinophagaceae bacterium]
MRIFIFLSAIITLFLFSCQKEVDYVTGNGGGGGGGTTSGNTLVKTVSKNGSDSVITVYTYNANKKLINEKITGMSQGIDLGNEYKYYRNASGIITRYVQINAMLAASGIDSVVTIVHYNSSSSRYTSTVSEISFSGFSVLDSTVFIYDASGKISESNLYLGIPLLGGYDLTDKFKYIYAANGNINQFDIYDLSSGTEDHVATTKYTFDAKTSPIIFNNEAFAIGHPDWVSVNNPTKVEIIDLTDPTNNYTLTFTYTYNSSNKPATSVNTQDPGNIVNNVTYYYQ